MRRQTLLCRGMGYKQRRFNDDISPRVRRIENWSKYGAVTVEHFGGRQNVICLQSKKRAARIRFKPNLPNDMPHVLSVDVYSPIENKTWGIGLVNGEWHPSNGMWKTIRAKLQDGKDIVITSIGKDDKTAPGDKCYVDLTSIKVN